MQRTLPSRRRISVQQFCLSENIGFPSSFALLTCLEACLREEFAVRDVFVNGISLSLSQSMVGRSYSGSRMNLYVCYNQK